jgi:sulfite exporter TauE/SafE
MQAELAILIITAISIAFLHTATGPDHYLPFIALSKIRGWSPARTVLWTIVCGCGHVWSSVLLGLGGAAIGWSLSKVKGLENIRGGLAGWALLGFGLLYSIWGLIKAKQNRVHKHFDINQDGSMYVYEHAHGEVVAQKDRHTVTPWVMFVIFVLGPCEPMIPLLYFPAAKSSWVTMTLLIIVYTVCTLFTMVLFVLLGFYGISLLKTEKLERYMHVLGGISIFICGAGMVFIGW